MSSEMQVSVEALDGLERRLTVEVPAERIDQAVTERLNELVKSVRLDGFRPGKVPFKVVQKRYGPQVRQEVLGEVIESSFRDAVSEEQLTPAGQPRIEALPVSESQAFRYSATFEVYPQIEIAALDSITVEKPVVEVADSDLEEMLQSLRRQRTEWEPVERVAADGDRVVIDFVGRVDGEVVDNASAEGYELVLGSGSLVPGFEEQLAGAAAGQEREVAVSFPQDYRPESLAGKDAVFSVSVKAVQGARLPELDDEFAQKFGVSEGGLERLRSNVRENMQRELNQVVRRSIKSQIMDGLLAANEVELPAALVHEEIHRLKAQLAQQTHAAQDELGDELFEGEARRRVGLGLIIAEVIKRNGLKAEPDKVRTAIEEIAAPYENPQQVVNYYYGNRELLGSVEAMVLEEQVVDWALGQATVDEVPKTFAEVMKPDAAPGAAEEGA